MFKDRQNCSVVREAKIIVASGNGGLTRGHDMMKPSRMMEMFFFDLGDDYIDV